MSSIRDIIENLLQNVGYSVNIKPNICIQKLQLCLSKYFFPITAIVKVISNIFLIWRIPSHGKNCQPEIPTPEVWQLLDTSRSFRDLQNTWCYSHVQPTLSKPPYAL